jgi:hypothetical protein
MAFLKNKLTRIALGAVLIGSIAGLLGARSAMPPSVATAGAIQPASDVSSPTGGSSSTAAADSSSATARARVTPTVTQVAQVAPTATPTRVPPTPTPIPVAGQQLTVRGTVTSVPPNTNTFVVHVPNGGGTYTCTVTSSTVWSGAASSINTLRVGMQVDASGIYQSGSGINPTSSVDADT